MRALLAGAATVPQEVVDRLSALGADAIRKVCGRGQVDLERAAYSDEARVVLYAEDELAIDHFAVYEVPIPVAFQQTRGRRTVKISLAFDPPVCHTRVDYAGIGMSFRLIRGCTAEQVFEHYRWRNVAVEGGVPKMENRFNLCIGTWPAGSRNGDSTNCGDHVPARPNCSTAIVTTSSCDAKAVGLRSLCRFSVLP